MSQITNSAPSLCSVNQFLFSLLSFPPTWVWGDFQNSCCFPVFPVIHWSSYMLRTCDAALSSWWLNRDEMDPSQPSLTLSRGVLLAADRERALLSIDHCNRTGHMHGLWGALQAQGSVTQPPCLQIENPTWLMSPPPVLIIFWLRFNHKSDNNSAAK